MTSTGSEEWRQNFVGSEQAPRLLSATQLDTSLHSTQGRYGTGTDYLLRTIDGLARHGIIDRGLARLHRMMATEGSRSSL